ncbi:phage adaptor protein [Aureimonas sp. AU40]|uniref:phage adaptor protein n=1 Tax=Aureimonas sp. AU40 TaxID=1637747 RepID=UPI00078391F6|nr:hypothetical protein [Aureimonas sp. AU40]
MTDFNELALAIPRWLNSDEDELVDELPSIIRSAEERLSRDLQHRALYAEATGTIYAGQSALSIPTDLIGVRRLAIVDAGETVVLRRRTISFLDEFAPRISLVGRPKFYAVRSTNSWRVARTPDADYPFELLYKRRLVGLSPQNPTNWLSENAYDALLHAACARAASFLHDDEKAATKALHEDEYGRFVSALNAESEEDEYQPGEAA